MDFRWGGDWWKIAFDNLFLFDNINICLLTTYRNTRKNTIKRRGISLSSLIAASVQLSKASCQKNPIIDSIMPAHQPKYSVANIKPLCTNLSKKLLWNQYPGTVKASSKFIEKWKTIWTTKKHCHKDGKKLFLIIFFSLQQK